MSFRSILLTLTSFCGVSQRSDALALRNLQLCLPDNKCLERGRRDTNGLEGARAFSVMSIAKLSFPRIWEGQDVLIWSITLPGPFVPAVWFWDHPVGGVRGPSKLSFYISCHLGLVKQESGGSETLTKQLPPLSWIHLEFWFFLNPCSCLLPWIASKGYLCVHWYFQISHQAKAYLSFFFKIDRWYDTGGSEFTPCFLFIFNHSITGYF